jgi:hypothetical protein
MKKKQTGEPKLRRHRHKWVKQGDRLVCSCGFYLSDEKPDPVARRLRFMLGMDAGPPAELPNPPKKIK